MEEQNAELRKLVDNELDRFVLYVLKRQDRIIPIVGDDCFFGKLRDRMDIFLYHCSNGWQRNCWKTSLPM